MNLIHVREIGTMLTYQQEKPKGGVGSHGVIIAAGAGRKNEENETKGEVAPGPGKRQGAQRAGGRPALEATVRRRKWNWRRHVHVP